MSDNGKTDPAPTPAEGVPLPDSLAADYRWACKQGGRSDFLIDKIADSDESKASYVVAEGLLRSSMPAERVRAVLAALPAQDVVEALDNFAESEEDCPERWPRRVACEPASVRVPATPTEGPGPDREVLTAPRENAGE